MDIVLDLWMNTVYNDEQVLGSEVAPVVYMRNGTGSPLVGYADLALRWGQSKATVGRVLKKLEHRDYISLLTFSGKYGSVISLKNYLSTMFQVSDVMIDKDEIAMSLNIRISLPDTPEVSVDDSSAFVSNTEPCVSKPYIEIVRRKAAEILAALGVSCCECPRSACMLSPLSSDCKGIDVLQGVPRAERFILEIPCCGDGRAYAFELTLRPTETRLEGGLV
jgi:hypothetical protein